jgi:hypothetical protein
MYRDDAHRGVFYEYGHYWFFKFHSARAGVPGAPLTSFVAEEALARTA